jgi:hypothetical protein
VARISEIAVLAGIAHPRRAAICRPASAPPDGALKTPRETMIMTELQTGRRR